MGERCWLDFFFFSLAATSLSLLALLSLSLFVLSVRCMSLSSLFIFCSLFSLLIQSSSSPLSSFPLLNPCACLFLSLHHPCQVAHLS
ncbi:hypothetical protein F5H01DRAFT_353312 [Linnemannia elongata]|nr:hypothetical protein F5H01DRAFT_353312 [Linnemannia elongata]